MDKHLAQDEHYHAMAILPVIPTMDIVVFPRMIVPLLVLDERIIRGIERAMETEDKQVFLIASRKQSTAPSESIGTHDLYEVGTIGTIMRLIRIPEGGIKILVQGNYKGVVEGLVADQDSLYARIQKADEGGERDNARIQERVKQIKDIAQHMSSTGNALSPDFHVIIMKMYDPEKIAEFLLSHVTLTVQQAQKLLESPLFADFLDGLYEHICYEVEASQTQERIKHNTGEAMRKSQREYYLREQMSQIRKELGDDNEGEITQWQQRLEGLSLSPEAHNEINRQIQRLEKTAPDSMEATVLRNYLDFALALPWGIVTEDNLDLAHARTVLDQDHYGLQDIKDRILDFMSIRRLRKDGHTPILCFAGPPGTGKTSLGASIARSLGRAYYRVSLGGVKDEAEIRGHRRTYVGAMPGRFLQAMRKVQTSNPVIIIDEIDKIGSDFRGDPSAAMLEILDPQQNKTFYDNYLAIPFDFSQVLFIATANNIENLSEPLRDRMEIIPVSGYTLPEKFEIARRYLVKRAQQENGLSDLPFEIQDEILHTIICQYTHESGVRELERVLKKLGSKMARAYVEEGSMPTLDLSRMYQLLGPARYVDEECDHTDMVGIANGLAWTAAGGTVLKIETIVMPGKGRLLLTGQLGDVMKESAQAALSYACAHAHDFGIDPKAFHENDIHIHVPAGAVPKDGPSAGITMLTSILSALTQRKIDASFAMTGELNLRGDVMRIGGVKEKILAAKRNNIPRVILPAKNKQDIHGLEEMLQDIDLIWVEHASEVLSRVLRGQDALEQEYPESAVVV